MADRFRALKTGPLELALDGADLRYVRFAGTEIVRRLYPAVRDEQWATPEATLKPAIVTGYEDRIEIRVDGSFRHDAIALDWIADIDRARDGTLRYRLQATAKSDFSYNRFGLCLLQPLAGFVGSQRALEGPGGRRGGDADRADRPAGRRRRPPPAADRAVLRAGDRRSRTWARCAAVSAATSSSSRISATGPTRRTRPTGRSSRSASRCTRRPASGSSRSIEIEPRWTPTPPAQRTAASVRSAHPVGALPPIGLSVPPGHARGGARSHPPLRAEPCAPARRRHGGRPRHAAARGGARARDGRGARGRAAHLRGSADGRGARRPDGARPGAGAHPAAPVGRSATNPASRRRSRRSCAATSRACRWSAARRRTSSTLNNGPFDLGTLDGVAYGIDPQVHASDEASIMETLEAQGDTVASARVLADGKPVSVGPIALRNRALGADPRQASSFCAAWTLGTINALARRSGVDHALRDGRAGIDGRRAWTLPGARGAGGARPAHGRDHRRGRAADPLALCALALQDEGRTRLLLANSRDAPMGVTVAGLRPDRRASATCWSPARPAQPERGRGRSFTSCSRPAD